MQVPAGLAEREAALHLLADARSFALLHLRHDCVRRREQTGIQGVHETDPDGQLQVRGGPSAVNNTSEDRGRGPSLDVTIWRLQTRRGLAISQICVSAQST